jgi:hypothetical protein
MMNDEWGQRSESDEIYDFLFSSLGCQTDAQFKQHCHINVVENFFVALETQNFA